MSMRNHQGSPIHDNATLPSSLLALVFCWIDHLLVLFYLYWTPQQLVERYERWFFRFLILIVRIF